MADLTTALIAQHLMNQRYQAAINTNTIPAAWQGLPATVANLDQKMNDLYLRVNTIPHETVKIQKDVEASASEWDTVLTIGLWIVGGLIALMTYSTSSFESSVSRGLDSTFMKDLLKDMETTGAKGFKRQSSRVVRAIRPK